MGDDFRGNRGEVGFDAGGKGISCYSLAVDFENSAAMADVQHHTLVAGVGFVNSGFNDEFP